MKGSGSNFIRIFGWAIIVVLFLCYANFAAAQNADSWQHEVTIYGWFAGIDGTVHFPGSQGSGEDFSVAVEDIIEDLEMVFMGGWASKKGRWSILADVVYTDVGDSANGVEVDFATWVLNGGVGYDLKQSDGGTLTVVGGVRYLSIEPEVKAGGYTQSASEGFVDAVIGLRGNVDFNKNWYLPFYADIGTGDSDVSYQLFAGLGYRFGWGDIRVGYRYLGYEMDDDALMKELSLSGPVMGVGFRF